MRERNTSTFTLAAAFKCAAQGISTACVTQRNFKIQLAIAVLAIALGLLCSRSATEWIAVIICIGLVLGLECLNTSIEALVDLVSPGYDKRAGIAKDCAAGAVLIASCASLIVGIIVFVPGILRLIGLSI